MYDMFVLDISLWHSGFKENKVPIPAVSDKHLAHQLSIHSHTSFAGLEAEYSSRLMDMQQLLQYLWDWPASAEMAVKSNLIQTFNNLCIVLNYV